VTRSLTRKRLGTDHTALIQIADRKVNTVQSIILTALQVARDSITPAEAESVLYGTPSTLRNSIDWKKVAAILGAPNDTYIVTKAKTAADTFGEVFISGGKTTAGQISGSMLVTSPAAIQYGEQRAGALIVGLQAEQLKNVQTVLAAGLGGDLPIDRVQSTIRNTVGLAPRQAQALVNYERGLLEAQLGQGSRTVLGGPGRPLAPRVALDRLSTERVDRAVETYRDRMLNYRARTIARTETVRAANAGAYEEMLTAGRNGMFDMTTARRVWSLTPDDRLCPECAEMEGQTIELEGTFQSVTTAADGSETTTDIEYPPLHPNCRCSFEVEIDEDSVSDVPLEDDPFFDAPDTSDLADVPDLEPTATGEPAAEFVPATVEELPLSMKDGFQFADPSAERLYGSTLDEMAKVHGLAPELPLSSTGEAWQTEIARLENLPGKPRASACFRPAGEGTGPLKTTASAPRIEVKMTKRLFGEKAPTTFTDEVSNMMHEVGHRVDAIYDSTTGRFSGWYSEGDSAAVLDFLEAATTDSPSFARGFANAEEIGKGDYFESAIEVWARAYNQWMAYEVEGAAPEVAELFATRSRGSFSGHNQWDPEEFRANIGPRVRAVLEERGLITETGDYALIDTGSVRTSLTETIATQAEPVFGTPEFYTPEAIARRIEAANAERAKRGISAF